MESRGLSGEAAELTYLGPQVHAVRAPTGAFLESLLLVEDAALWLRDSGDSTLCWAVHSAVEAAIVHAKPMLTFFVDEHHGVFMCFCDAEQDGAMEWVPCSGGEGRPWVHHYIGGESFYAPRACFVSRPVALRITADFIQSGKRSAAVSWVERSSLNFPFPGAGDPIPGADDLV